MLESMKRPKHPPRADMSQPAKSIVDASTSASLRAGGGGVNAGQSLRNPQTQVELRKVVPTASLWLDITCCQQ